MSKTQILIEYSARQDTNYEKAYRSLIYVNGKWRYNTARCKRTMTGALAQAKRLAEQHAKSYPSLYTEVTIRER